MKNSFRRNFLSQTLPIVALGAMSLSIFCLSVSPLRAQPIPEQEFRPAITTENDKTFLRSLITSSLIALNQANSTNNYSVLRELSSPTFQANNSNEDLQEIFAEIRNSNLDFSAIVNYEPVFEAEPVLDSQNNLLVKGYFPAALKIEFDFVYQLIDGNFVIDVFSVSIAPNSEAPEADR